MWEDYKLEFNNEDKLIIINKHVLVTAEIFYFFPDYPNLLQTYIWQENDNLPEYPKLNGFLNFWEKEIEGKLHSVIISANINKKCGEYKFVDHQLLI